jgi:molybdopterin-binding protein
MTSKISARNQFEGKIAKVTKGGVVSAVEVKAKVPLKITSVITTSSAKEMKLKVGDTVTAIIKSTEVMIGKE